VITLRYDERPWTANAARSASHWTVVARKTAKWRSAWRAIGIANHVIDIGPCIITATPYLRDGRGRQDVAACFPAVKAAIDGLCDAGAWEDDDPRNVVELRFEPPVRGQGDGLELRIEPVTTPALGGPRIQTR
jgi:hypothetical protein